MKCRNGITGNRAATVNQTIRKTKKVFRMLEKIYGLADFAAAAILVFGGAPAPALLVYFLAAVLVLKGALSFVPVPLYMPSLLMCGTDIAVALLLFFEDIFLPLKAAVILIMLVKAVPGLVFSLLGK